MSRFLLKVLPALLLLWGTGPLTACSKSEDEAVGSRAEPTASPKDQKKGDDPDQPSSLASAEATADPKGGDQFDTPGEGRGQGDQLSAMSMPSAADCVRKCVEQNQMRAEGPEKIAADCRTRCRGACEKRCTTEAEGRPSSFGDQCRDDCKQQVGGEQH